MRTFVLLSLFSVSKAWLGSQRPPKGIFLSMSSSGDSKKIDLDVPNPCWEDFYDDDCVMSNAASASFVAADWIRKMPCGEGIEDCDMPGGLSFPATRPEAGVEKVDVMDFLGLRRAEGVRGKKEFKP